MSTHRMLRPSRPRCRRSALRPTAWRRWLALTAWMALVTGAASPASALPGGFTDEQVAGGLDQPTAMAFAPDGRIFVAEQTGALRVVKAGTLRSAPFVRLTVDSLGERGLIGVTLHPNFASNGFVYVYHTVPGTPARNRVTRFTANGDVAQAGSAVTILDLDDLRSARNHNGGALHFGADGKLYVAVGDNALPENAQSLANRLGKMLRINADGSIPADNPTRFPGIAGTTSGANRAIWAVGLRNPFTFAIQPHRGVMLINEVGAATYEEINRGAAGANYGWPTTEGPTGNPAFTGPVFAYRHDTGTPTGCAITGGAFYNPPQASFPSSYVGRYFFADYCGDWIYHLDPAAPRTATPFHAGLRSPVNLAVGTDGSLYYLQRGDGSLRRIRYSGDTAQAVVLSTGDLTIREGRSATVTVKLAARPGSQATVAVTRQLGDSSIAASKQTLTFTRSNWNVAQPVAISAKSDDDEIDDGARFRFALPGLPSARLAVIAVDDDRPAGAPRAVITRPRPADFVSGATAEFFGDGLSAGTVVRAEFWVNGARRYVDRNRTGHYHFGGDHNRWNTTALPNGVHTLTMRVFDAQGRSGAHSVRVHVRN